MPLDKVLTRIIFAENLIEIDCDVAALYEYSCMWTPPFSSLMNTDKILNIM
jgi:hypothetical protein